MESVKERMERIGAYEKIASFMQKEKQPYEYKRKKILDVTCGSKTIWFNKNHPAAVYCDKRSENLTGIWKSTNGESERTCTVSPDIQCDFTNLPFGDNTFALVVFDPPHLEHVGENAWMKKKYGRLEDNWPQMLHDGFRECMRVLKPDGVLIFKWSECQIPANKVWDAIGQKPLFGHRSGKASKTFWGCYMKGITDFPEVMP
jgi:ubiquinone/menaquinone biosynthesis C-methylase UbiE